MSDEAYLDIDELASVLNVSPEEVRTKSVKADENVLKALQRGSARLVREVPTMKSPNQLRNQFTAVEHHGGRKSQVASTRAVPVVNKTDQSRYQAQHHKLKRKVLAIRPPTAPNIIDEVKGPVKMVIHQHQSPGDILMLTAAVRDLHKTFPGKFITDIRTTCMELWEHNPYKTQLDDKDPNVHHIYCDYPLIQQSNESPFHFIHGFIKDFESKLGVVIKPTSFKGDVHISNDEKGWLSQVYEETQRQIPYWIIDAGHKMDFTAKHWGTSNYQAVVDALPEITFVQVGAADKTHRHPRLKGKNVIDLVGKTSMRQFVRLMYNACGVITPVSFPMHLAAAVEPHPWYKRQHRPCITIGGGREPSSWEAYSNHQFLHTCGLLPCNKQGGCWKSRTMPVGDGDSKDTQGLCERPVENEKGEIVPACMDLIQPSEVIQRVKMYLRYWDYASDNPDDWGPIQYEGYPDEVIRMREEAVNKKKGRKKK